MSYSAEKIIQINTAMRAAGLGFANFASACLFVTEAEAPAGFEPDTFREYSRIDELQVDFASATQAYQAANRWLGGIPATRSLFVYVMSDEDSSIVDSLGKARNQRWWYFTFLTAANLESLDTVESVAQWADSNGSFFVNSQTGTNCSAIRDLNTDEDIASRLTTLGIRHAATFANAEDANSGQALMKHFAAVNYNGVNTTITGEGKKSPGVYAESLTTTEYTAMEQKHAVFYTQVDLQGSTDMGRWLNTKTHSSYGEYIDDVINLDAFVNGLTVTLYNTIIGATRKIPQTPVGQAIINGAVRRFCQKYIDNGYLGARNYINPDTGEDDFTNGFEVLTTADDILFISDEQRDNRESAPIRVRIFRAGAIHKAIVDIDIY